jgi:hypothetical protein
MVLVLVAFPLGTQRMTFRLVDEGGGEFFR